MSTQLVVSSAETETVNGRARRRVWWDCSARRWQMGGECLYGVRSGQLWLWDALTSAVVVEETAAEGSDWCDYLAAPRAHTRYCVCINLPASL